MANGAKTELHVFLLEGARWQDFLLQSYRTLHLTVQGIFLAIGTGLVVAGLGFDNLSKARAVAGIFVVIATLSLALLKAMRRLVLARGKDVNFWHKQIIDLEKTFPGSQRYFTLFKINQKDERDRPLLTQLFLREDSSQVDTNLLIEGQLGHNRKILDSRLFGGIVIVWGVLLIICIHIAKPFP